MKNNTNSKSKKEQSKEKEKANVIENIPELKIIVIGDSNVGKTNLITRIISNTFAENHSGTIRIIIKLFSTI